MKTIIIGSNHINTAGYHAKLGLPQSTLILSANQDFTIGHTSVQDIPDLEELTQTLDRAEHVYWAMCKKDEFSDENSYYDFLNWLKNYNLSRGTVKNLSSIAFDPYGWGGKISTSEDNIIFYGCSFTAGTGLSDQQTHYAVKLSHYFNKKCLNLATPGGSNSLVFDKFVRTEFVPNQLVVVQFTEPARLHYCRPDKKLVPLILARENPFSQVSHRSLFDVYNSSFLFYDLLTKIKAIVEIARSKRLRLIFWFSDYKNNGAISKLDQTYFYNMPEFVPSDWIQNYLVDAAEDNLHPGIESNRRLTDILAKYIETIY